MLITVAAAVLFTNLGKASLHGDEAIYAAVAQRCAETGHCFPLESWHGRPYLDKPPLQILAEAALFRAFGPSELTARVLPVLAGLLTVLLVFDAGRRLEAPCVGLLAGFVLLSAQGWVLDHGARQGVLDVPVALCGLVALLAWMRARAGRFGRPQLPPLAVFAVIVAELVKTVHGVLFAGLLCVLAVLVRRRGERVRDVLPTALAILGFAVAAEVVLVLTLELSNGGPVIHRLLQQTVQRAVSGIDPRHLHGPLFYPRLLWRDFGPWLLGAPLVFLWARRRGPALAVPHMAAWCGGLLGIASLSVSKLPWYLYSIYPVLSLLTALGAAALLERSRPRAVRMAFAAVLATGAAAGIVAIWLQTRQPGVRLPLDSVARSLAADRAVVVRMPEECLLVPMPAWDWWYLHQVARLATARKVSGTGGNGRDVALTVSPIGYLARQHDGWRAVTCVPIGRGARSNVWVLATFPFSVPGPPPPPAVDLSGVLFVGRFESGHLDGWEPSSVGAEARPVATPTAPDSG